MSVNVTVPLTNGDGSAAAFTLQLPASTVGSEVIWSASTSVAKVVPANDGQSALLTPLTTGTYDVTAAVYDSPGSWEAGKLYLVGQQILDGSHRIQKVVAGKKQFEARYTPLAGDIPQGGNAFYFAQVTLTVSAGSAGAPTNVYTVNPSISAALAASLVGKVIAVSGFITNASNNGEFVCVAATTTSVTLGNPNGISETPGVAGKGQSLGTANDPLGNANLLNSDGGAPVDPDWPIGATLPAGANTNGQVANRGLVVAAAGAGTHSAAAYAAGAGASVAFVSGGYSAGSSVGSLAESLPSTDGSQQGIDSPTLPVQWYDNEGNLHTDFTSDARITIAEYTPYGPSGTVTYIDIAGISRTTGWVIAEGTQNFSEGLVGQPPAFNGSGSDPVYDGDLTWQWQSTESASVTYSNIHVVVTADGPGVLPVPNNSLIIS